MSHNRSTFSTGRANVEKNQTTEGCTQDQRRVWNTHTINCCENPGRFSFDGQAVQGSGPDIQIRIGSAHDKNKDCSIDDMVQDFDANL